MRVEKTEQLYEGKAKKGLWNDRGNALYRFL